MIKIAGNWLLYLLFIMNFDFFSVHKKESLAITSWKLCEQMNMALLTGPPAVLKLFVLGALLVLKLSLY